MGIFDWKKAVNNACKWEYNETVYTEPKTQGRNKGTYSGVEAKAV